MAATNFEQFFEKAFPLDSGATLTVTEVPDCEEELLRLLERAMLRGFDNHARLTEIHLPMERFPFMDSKFWHVPIEDCGKAQVLRFFFEAPDTQAH
ncbi:hypothetical protein LG047_08045 [Methylocystis sp. WRRC1]|uniref:hypothetical protein n=1 Tax=unclassified Methylocystis TaxID=2625913 RepID=UPI0001F87BDF|nr:MULTISPECIES: hypothetical protein [unclassified Methylocystis]MCC3245272.1 hypothetical protein [Methylocystis sp. WRRC1]